MHITFGAWKGRWDCAGRTGYCGAFPVHSLALHRRLSPGWPVSRDDGIAIASLSQRIRQQWSGTQYLNVAVPLGLWLVSLSQLSIKAFVVPNNSSSNQSQTLAGQPVTVTRLGMSLIATRNWSTAFETLHITASVDKGNFRVMDELSDSGLILRFWQSDTKDEAPCTVARLTAISEFGPGTDIR